MIFDQDSAPGALRVGVIGLGKMGGAFARRLLAYGNRVEVWNRSIGPLGAFANAGAVPHTSVTELVEAVDVVLVMLWGDDAANEITLAQIIPAMRPSQVLIEMSTLSPDMYATLEEETRKRGGAFVAAPVLGNPVDAKNGSLTILAGGVKADVGRVLPLLGVLGHVIEMPSVRASGYLKLANNTVLGVIAETLGELLEMCDRAGIDRNLSVQSLVGALQRVAQQKLPQLLAHDEEPRFTLDALLKDLHLAERAADSLHVSVPVLEAVVPNAEGVAESGFGDRDYIALALERNAGAPKRAAAAG